jgi:hypothetical protein
LAAIRGGIVCGHIHRADLREVDGLIYANDGDWVESLSAIAEDAEGNLQLLTHGGAERGRISSLFTPSSKFARAA